MLFTEFRFLIFFAVVFCLYWAMKSNTARKWLLLFASYGFYGAWSWKFLLLIIASTLVDFFIGIRLGSDTKHKSKWMSVSVCWNLGVLGFFKYFNFFIQSGHDFLGWLGLSTNIHTLSIILPVGISFFTFQSMSYSIDIYRGILKPTKNLLNFSTFIAFFPQLFAGPIVRAIDFLPQLDGPRHLVKVRGRDMVMMFIIGYIKKSCVANNLAPFVDEFFAHPEHYSVAGCWTAVMFYAVQIYCDFSGYTDMAIATAGLLGYEFVPNFNFPYFATNITVFWRRWHMSLSSWLRDYLYIPLGGNRGGKWFTYRNLMLTFVLGGLWHGAAWTFVIWGVLHGFALIAHREIQRFLCWLGFKETPKGEKPSAANRVLMVLGAFLTFYWVCIAWVFFRAATFKAALHTLNGFVLFRSSGTTSFSIACVLSLLGLIVIHFIAYQKTFKGWWQRIAVWQFAIVCGVIVASALPWTPMRYQPFIYFQF